MFRIADGLARYMAPLLAFTGDEIYSSLHQAEPGTVHEREFPAPVSPETSVRDAWRPLLAAREAGLKVLETARAAKVINSSLEASLVIRGSAAALAPLLAHEALPSSFPGNLANLFIVSRVRLEEGPSPELQIEVRRAEGLKCSRCWTYFEGAREGAPREGRAVCPRCSRVVHAEVRP
jgi:isoleucyl-tRNA synthetase